MHCCSPPAVRHEGIGDVSDNSHRLPLPLHAACQPGEKAYSNADIAMLPEEKAAEGYMDKAAYILSADMAHEVHEALINDISAAVARVVTEGLTESRSILCTSIQGMLSDFAVQVRGNPAVLKHNSTGFSAMTFGEQPSSLSSRGNLELHFAANGKSESKGTAFFGSDVAPRGSRGSESPRWSSGEDLCKDVTVAHAFLQHDFQDAPPAPQQLAQHTRLQTVRSAVPLPGTHDGTASGGDPDSTDGLDRVLQAYRRASGPGSQAVQPMRRTWFRRNVKDGVAASTVATRRLKVDAVWDFSMIQKAREALDVREYDVTAFYKDSGWAQYVAKSEFFNNLVLAMVVANAVYIGIEANYNTAATGEDIAVPWQVSEHFFCAFFVLEWIVRFAAFARKRDGFRDNWFRLDSALALLGSLEVWVMPVIIDNLSVGTSTPTGSKSLRLVRLLRLARSVRLFHFLPELLTMVKGMQVAGRAVASSLILLALLVYTFSVMLYLGFGDLDEVSSFLGTLPLCMQTLFVRGILMDEIAELSEALLGLDPVSASLSFAIFLIFTLISSMTVMNMLIGILVEVVSAVAQGEKEQATIRMMKKSLLVALVRLDGDGNGEITQEEFLQLLREPDAMDVCEELKVDLPYLFELQERLYQKPGRQLPISFIMNLILDCRGDYPAKVKDVIEGHAFTRWVIVSTLERIESRIIDMLHRIEGRSGTGLHRRAAQSTQSDIPTDAAAVDAHGFDAHRTLSRKTDKDQPLGRQRTSGSRPFRSRTTTRSSDSSS